jgi:hypothetical protein
VVGHGSNNDDWENFIGCSLTYSSSLKLMIDLQGFMVYDELVVSSHIIDSSLGCALNWTTR